MALQPILNKIWLRGRVLDSVRRGIDVDSLRRQLNRENFSTRGLGLGKLYKDNLAELQNMKSVLGINRNAKPRLGTTIIERPLKSGFNIRYVVRFEVRDENNRFMRHGHISVDSDSLFTKGFAERAARERILDQANRERYETQYKSTSYSRFTLVNVFANEGADL